MLIVDGNNVLSPHQPWHRADWGPRERLLHDLGSLTATWVVGVDVVFGGASRRGMLDGAYVGGIRVWLTGARPPEDRAVELAAARAPPGRSGW